MRRYKQADPAIVLCLALAAMLVAATGFPAAVLSEEQPSNSAAACAASQLSLDISSLETLYLRPELVLANVDSFWAHDRAYWLISQWHKDVGQAIPPFGWKYRLEQLAARSAEGRDTTRVIRTVRAVAGAADSLAPKCMSHICSFLPVNGIDISTDVYFTGLVVPNGIQKYGDVVLNANAIATADEAWHTIIHEVFHVGFYANVYFLTDTLIDNAEKHDLFEALMNEGCATYVSYMGWSIAAPGSFAASDYEKLESDSAVVAALTDVNRLAEMADSEPPEAFRKQLFDIGVQRRALYVAGGHMARTIDQQLGRNELIQSIASGPRTFIARYNTVAPEDRKVIEYSLPDTLSEFQQLRAAAVTGEYARLREIISRLQGKSGTLQNPPGHVFELTGHLMMLRDSLDLAIQVFDLYKDLFPRHLNPYEGLADVYLLKGDTTAAINWFEELLEVSPGNARATGMMRALGKTESKTAAKTQ